MTVYVDNMAATYGRMIMCHCWADSLDELLAMMDTIGVQRKWLQQPPKASWVHFDISLAKKKLAIANGAVLTDQFGPVEHTSRLNLLSADPAKVAHGKIMLERIAKSRALRAPPEEPPLTGEEEFWRLFSNSRKAGLLS